MKKRKLTRRPSEKSLVDELDEIASILKNVQVRCYHLMARLEEEKEKYEESKHGRRQ